MFLKWLRNLDGILRGETTRITDFQKGQFEPPIGGLCVLIILLGAFYGLCMGTYALTMRDRNEALFQLFTSAAKVPLLYLLTLAITFPSLYVFNALVGTHLSVLSVLRHLIATLAVITAVAASLGPIVAFFALSTTSYPFMLLLNVAACGVAGVLGLAFLLRTLNRVVLAHDLTQVSLPDKPDDDKGALDSLGVPSTHQAKTVFRMWMVVFALVGAQMAWVLRPFIGSPELPPEWFRSRYQW